MRQSPANQVNLKRDWNSDTQITNWLLLWKSLIRTISEELPSDALFIFHTIGYSAPLISVGLTDVIQSHNCAREESARTCN